MCGRFTERGAFCRNRSAGTAVRGPQFGAQNADVCLSSRMSRICGCLSAVITQGFPSVYIRSQPPGTSGTVAPTSGRCSYGPSYSIGFTISGAKAAVLLAESNRLIAFCVLPAYRETSQHQAASLGGS